jgi:hypothetical protein
MTYTPPDTYTVNMLTGLADVLNASGAGVYRGPTGTYTSAERGIYFSAMPPDAVQGISITRYLDVPDIIAINHVRVQVLTRAGTNPLDGEAITDLVRDTLHDKNHVALNGVHVDRIRLESFTPLGPDDNGRFEYSQNFTLTGNRYSVQNP